NSTSYVFHSAAGVTDCLHSFPTRRSSDLYAVPTATGCKHGFYGLTFYFLAVFAALFSLRLLLTAGVFRRPVARVAFALGLVVARSEEHTAELQSPYDLVCRILREKKKKTN